MNRSRQEKLDPEQFIFIMKEARKSGCHIIAHFINDECAYQEPIPVEPRDEYADLQREHIKMMKQQEKLLERMNRAQLRLEESA